MMLFIGSTFATITIVPPDARTHTYSFSKCLLAFNHSFSVCFCAAQTFQVACDLNPDCLSDVAVCVFGAYVYWCFLQKVVQQEKTETFKVMRRFALVIFAD